MQVVLALMNAWLLHKQESSFGLQDVRFVYPKHGMAQPKQTGREQLETNTGWIRTGKTRIALARNESGSSSRDGNKQGKEVECEAHCDDSGKGTGL